MFSHLVRKVHEFVIPDARRRREQAEAQLSMQREQAEVYRRAREAEEQERVRTTEEEAKFDSELRRLRARGYRRGPNHGLGLRDLMLKLMGGAR